MVASVRAWTMVDLAARGRRDTEAVILLADLSESDRLSSRERGL
jgi:hypothetical protein